MAGGVMTIRKLGTVTGAVTEVESPEDAVLGKRASLAGYPGRDPERDELDDENRQADEERPSG
jgi:hypothetical protein